MYQIQDGGQYGRQKPENLQKKQYNRLYQPQIKLSVPMKQLGMRHGQQKTQSDIFDLFKCFKIKMAAKMATEK